LRNTDPTEKWGEPPCLGGLSSSCSTSDIHRVSLAS